ncbi:MAG: hypothetical protein A4E49_01909 [Methanosaeta sp. PtaU1.Bin112]|nr:MAG: hypothetical protein A4E49_01909 [Methanosaeta sp. PtaU1.Bin112]
MVEGSDLPVIEASEILERIEHGEPVIYEHVAIAGDIDLSRLDLPFIHNERSGDMSTLAHVLASRIEIRNSDFLGRINFVNSIFREPLDLSGSTFRQEASFKWATFDGGARFEGASFLRYASFRDAAFLKEAKFQEASFFAIANFGRALFCCPANFVSASFSELCANFLEASFRNDADWTGSRFSGTANFNSASFGGSTSFWNSYFNAEASFQGAKFAGYASFQGVLLLGNADLRATSFQEDLNMEFAQFRGNAIFIGTCISGDATFFRTRFANVSFKDATLNGMVQFSEAIFGQADFQGAQFGGKSSWQASLFQGDAGFDGALFLGRTSFPTATFLAMVSFTSARFQEEAFFEGTVFAKTADYSTAIFQKGISFAGATIDKMRLLKAQISSQISLQNAEFNRLEARWPVLCNHLRYDGETYLSLARNYRNLEWFEDADDCYYHYRRASQAAKSFTIQEEQARKINWSKLLDGLAWISCGYGVRPRYTVFLSGFFILLFAFLYWQGMGIVVEPLNGSEYIQGQNEELTFLDNLYFSAMVFTAKTQVKWYPVGVYRYLATLESILGWLLLALFLVSLGRTMIR